MSFALDVPRARTTLCVPIPGDDAETTRCLCFPLLAEDEFQAVRRDLAYGVKLPVYGFFDTDEPPLINGVASWSTRPGSTWFDWIGPNPGQPTRPNPTRFFTQGERMAAQWMSLPAFLPLIAGLLGALLLYTHLLGWHPIEPPAWAALPIGIALVVTALGAGIVATTLHRVYTCALWANLPALPPAIANLAKKYRPSYTKIYIVADLSGRWMLTETRRQVQFKEIDREAVVEVERKRERRLARVQSLAENEIKPGFGLLVGAKYDTELGVERLCLIREFNF